ncbi:alpha/beta hydrolase [Georgenia muralis]|uniref:S-formylglutathione hydrolase FrmB n=1 Tax=Georgenia muralis TaxID=154117 RepID=A0A3N4ZSF4_9MICO|nr:alpha/beta hydrolase family protein [Georgenia muralis]RPF28422.1 S-formylglutathione hydrolase FrmB [Georgenia muralis]
MALLRCDFFSDVLGVGTSMSVILPQPTSAQIGLTGAAPVAEPPVLYLLHGMSDDATTWVRRTSIERYTTELGLAVVMPQVGRSFYVDEHHGSRYGEFVQDELPALVQRFFRVSDRREDTFVAGLSMGGYGAFRWALDRPERFAAAASLSGVLDLAGLRSARPDLEPVFGPGPVGGSRHDLVARLADVDTATVPRLWAVCGTEDELLPGNETFVAAARAADVPLTWSAGPGRHDWAYWDARIQDVLAWLPLAHRKDPTS